MAWFAPLVTRPFLLQVETPWYVTQYIRMWDTTLRHHANIICQEVEVPGGQQVYVDPTGALSFTQAHSASIPAGSVVGGLVYETGQPWSHYSFNGWGTQGLMACPTTDNRWQVFAALQNATVPSGDVADCLGFSAIALTYSGEIPAWQYI